MIAFLSSIEWIVTAGIAFGVSLIALKIWKLSPLWALLIGMAVFTGLWFPIQTHAVMLEMPRPSN